MPTLKTARTTFLAFAALGVVHLAPPAHASDVTADKISTYAEMMKMKPVDVMHMMDADGNGFVTRDEFMKFQEKMFTKMDKNGDGKLGAKEFGVADRGDGGG